jgi:uncharacterized protein YjdB
MKRTLIAAALAAAAVTTGATAASSTLTLAASTPIVTYGKTTVLTGQLTPAQANQNININAQACPATTFKKTANVKTAATGAFTATVTPTTMTTYKASLKNSESPTVVVKVKPVVRITRVKRGSFTATVTAGLDLKGKTLVFQRYAKLRKRWVQVKKVTLTTSTPGPAKPTVISSAAFKAKVARLARVRLLLSTAQAAPCYVTTKSNVVRN